MELIKTDVEHYQPAVQITELQLDGEKRPEMTSKQLREQFNVKAKALMQEKNNQINEPTSLEYVERDFTKDQKTGMKEEIDTLLDLMD